MMKIILILLLILLPIADAENIIISLSKEDYHQYETLQAEIFTNLTLANKLTASNFALIDKNNKTIPIAIFLEELSNDHYFIYFDIPKLNNDTYYFLVKDIIYIDNILKQTSKFKEFHLTNISSVSIYPAIINKIDSTNLKIKNYGVSVNLTLKADEINLNQTITLKEEFNTNIKIPKNINNFNIEILYGERSYSIPVIPYAETIINFTAEENKSLIEEKKPLILPQKNALVLLNSTYGSYFDEKIILRKDDFPKGSFYIKNEWDFQINNITFNLTGNLNEIARLNLTFISEIRPNETIVQYIWINEDQNSIKSLYSGSIQITSLENTFARIPLEIIFLEDKLINETVKEEIIKKNYTKPALLKNEEKQNLAIIPLILVLLILLTIIYFIFKKSKQTNF